MNNLLLSKYIKELKLKISLKMIPNKTEDYILYQNFKFFDLDSSGFCNLQNFMRANEKIGVVMNKVNDLQEIFNYFDKEKSGVIDYKKFCKEIFNLNIENDSNENNTNFNNNLNNNNLNYKSRFNQKNNSNIFNDETNNKKPFFEKLINILSIGNGPKNLMNLHKQFKIVDFNNINRLTIEDFIKIISENKIGLSISDIQILFHNYEFNSNGIFYYEQMFKDLKNFFWNNYRELYIEDIYNSVYQGKEININDFRNLFNINYNQILNDFGIEQPKDFFYDLIDSFLTIKKVNRINNIINKNLFIDFFKYLSFGLDVDEDYFNLINNSINVNNINNNNNNNYNNNNNNKNRPLTPDYPRNNNNYNYNYPNNNNNNLNSNNLKTFNKNKNNNNNDNKYYLYSPISNNNNNNINLEPSIEHLRNSIKSNGLRSFFSLIKHFKYFDNGTKFITKYDFAKVIKNFRLNLTIAEIEKIFDKFCNDTKKVQLNYEKFLEKLLNNYFNINRRNVVDLNYEKIVNYAKKINEKVSIDLIKSLYYSKNNFFGLDESQSFNEFCDNIEVFHYSIKNIKNNIINLEEFEDFYKMVSFIVDNDGDFENIVNNEWKKVNEEDNNNYNNNNNDNVKKNLNDVYSPFGENNNNNFNKNEFNKLKQNLKSNNNNYKNNYNNFDELRSNYHSNISHTTREARTPYNRPSSTKNNNNNNYNINKNYNINNNNNNNYYQNDPLQILTNKLRLRGIRGVMNLHKQFIFTCSNLSTINLNDLIKVLTLQRFGLSKNDCEKIFYKFCDDNKEYLLFSNFIRNFKKVLNNNRLDAVENAFNRIDKNNTEMVFSDDIKLKFNAKKHPEVLKGNKNEEEILTEFLDCFELNYNLLTTSENPETSNLVSYEEFANFYEYVSFLYENDKDFINMLEAVWS